MSLQRGNVEAAKPLDPKSSNRVRKISFSDVEIRPKPKSQKRIVVCLWGQGKVGEQRVAVNLGRAPDAIERLDYFGCIHDFESDLSIPARTPTGGPFVLETRLCSRRFR